MIHFDLPKDRSSILKVIGVGGGGSNAINHMHGLQIGGVDFIICNTDSQSLTTSKVPNKVHLGPNLTQGLGAGANPEIGRQATEESLEELRRILEVNTKMAFITAGMGGGTGTGGAPVIAKICKDLGILTVGIVTTPFGFEGPKRQAQALEGIAQLKQYVDTMLVISNDKLRHQFGNLKMSQAFAKADNVLSTAAKCITDVINSTGMINTDFADVKTVMQNGGVAILGNATATGENRAQSAIEQALNSPLLNDNNINGAKWILLNINTSEGDFEFTMDEVDLISSYLRAQSGDGANVILGTGYDESLGDQLSVTLIATGFKSKDPFEAMEETKPKQEEQKVFVTLENQAPVQKSEIESAPMQALELKEAMHATDAIINLELQETKMEEVPTEIAATTPLFVQEEEIVNEEAPLHFELFIKDEVGQQENALPTLEEEQLATDGITLHYKQDADADNVHSIGFLNKPSNIYNDNNVPAPAPVQPTLHEAPVFNFDTAPKPNVIEEETLSAQPIVQQEELPAVDEAEEGRRRAQERIMRLRNLSFTPGELADEYDNVPAFMRRNVDISGNNGPENFYSNTTVKVDENNNTQISTINHFLDGKKPD